MITLFILYKIISSLGRTKRQRPGRTTRRTTKTTTTIRIAPNKQSAASASRRDNIEFKRLQAQNDITHFTQVKADLLKAYELAACDGDTEKAIRKRIGYDNAIRTVDRKIEKAEYELKRTM